MRRSPATRLREKELYRSEEKKNSLRSHVKRFDLALYKHIQIATTQMLFIIDLWSQVLLYTAMVLFFLTLIIIY